MPQKFQKLGISAHPSLIQVLRIFPEQLTEGGPFAVPINVYNHAAGVDFLVEFFRFAVPPEVLEHVKHVLNSPNFLPCPLSWLFKMMPEFLLEKPTKILFPPTRDPEALPTSIT